MSVRGLSERMAAAVAEGARRAERKDGAEEDEGEITVTEVEVLGAPILVLDGVFSPDECARLVRAMEDERSAMAHTASPGGSNRKRGTRVCFRAVLDDASGGAAFVREWEERVRPFIPAALPSDDGAWEFAGLNPRARACFYEPGGLFAVHQDRGWTPDPDSHRSMLTCMVYFNGGFAGGHTRFFAGPRSRKIVHEVIPRPGRCVMFDQRIFHDGQAVRSGRKFMARTDVMFRRSTGVRARA